MMDPATWDGPNHDERSSNSTRVGCGRASHFSRRTLLQFAALGAGLSGWTRVAEALARSSERGFTSRPQSVIVLWLQGGPSQLDTFDPHPGTAISGGIKAIKTAAAGVHISQWFPLLAEQMQSVALVRSVFSKEGDHERATYNMKTGFRPDPTLVHPAIGSVLCHQLTDSVEIPRHISILPGQWPARGGYLGDGYDAFKVGDPAQPVADVRARVDDRRLQQRIEQLNFVEQQFARSRLTDLDTNKTSHRAVTAAALRMMSSEQLAAFDVSTEPAAVRTRYGDTPFGRGCLAARRLIEVGVRCVEVTLDGWDSHVNNKDIQRDNSQTLDAAFAALLQDLRERDLLSKTVVLCGGEFGRTPFINPLEGRDHWPHAFSVALAGGPIRGGVCVGETTPTPARNSSDRSGESTEPCGVADIHATIFAALGVEFTRELQTPVGRPMQICEGEPIRKLLAS